VRTDHCPIGRDSVERQVSTEPMDEGADLMRAVQVQEHGGPAVLQVTELAEPEPGEGEVLVEVAAAGVNFIDTYQRSGAYAVDLPMVPGMEGAGRVVAVGPGVEEPAVGSHVAWAAAPGSYAERVVVAAERAVPVAEGIDLEVAAALMLQGMTAHYLTHSTAHLGEDDTVLVYAAAGGVGQLLVQLAHRRGARVLACTSTDAKALRVTDLGADEVIRYRDVSVPEVVGELTGGRGVDVVYDSVGADTFQDSLRCLRPRGLMVLFGQSSGPVPPIDLQELNRAGSVYVTRPSLFHYVATHDELEWRATTLLDLVATGQLDVGIHARIPLAEAARAHEALESGDTSGKLLLVP
jgi:NADPH:quinone reductase